MITSAGTGRAPSLYMLPGLPSHPVGEVLVTSRLMTRLRWAPCITILAAACAGLNPSGGGQLVAGINGDRVCGDSALFIQIAGTDTFAEEGLILSPDSLRWSEIATSKQVRLAAPIDRGLLIREAVTRHRFATDSLLTKWTALIGRLEIRGDTAHYAFGDQAATVQRGPIARDAAVMIPRSAAFDEILIRRARMTGRDSVDIPTYAVGENRTPAAHVRFIRPDSVKIRIGDDEMVTEALVDPVGRILTGTYQAKGDTPVAIRRLRCSR